MNIKKFSDFSLNENIEDSIADSNIEEAEKEEATEEAIEDNIENKEDVSEPSEDGLPFSSDLSDIGEEANDEEEFNDSNLADFSNFNSKKNESITPIEKTGGCNIVIINGCEPDSEIDKKTAEFKTKCAGECKEIYLYQLNIQTAKKQEPKDGMMQVYEALEFADAIVFACQIVKGKLSESLEIAISRIKNFYKKEELKNKVFGAIIIGNDEKIKNDLILTALNDFHMVVSGDTLSFSNDKGAVNLTKMIDSITKLASATALIDDEVESKDDSDIESFDKFTKSEEKEEKNEEDDDYVNKLKGMTDLSLEDEEEKEEEKEEKEETSEEEERLIDNENGTITQIHKGEKVTENVILPFDKFFDK